ncbi:Electron transfer flavoprotein, beta subunit [mine drainage metagenome]|uniref:Electron transfer flavoprotein, beta subunit n=1 Tax=mine drainage metagenome TaxID=410659 RepID=T1C9W2_9ZZZZ
MVDIIVLVKQMPDLEQVKIDPATREPLLKNVPRTIETLSEHAVEEAVRIKEKFKGKITAILLGNEQSSAIMKKAFAIGADEGIIIDGYEESNPANTARILASKIKEIKHDIVILGNQSADSITGLIPGMISSILKEPLLGNAGKIDIDGNKVKIMRILEEDNVEIESTMPAIISITQEINEPRLPPVMQIMAAGKKPIKAEKITPLYPKGTKLVSNRVPKSERKKLIFEDIDKGIPEIVKVLKEG